MLGFLWPHGPRRIRRQGQRRQARRHPRRHRRRSRSRSTCREARTYVVQYPKDDLPAGQEGLQARSPTRAWKQGFVALYQRCVHLGCRVPFCQTSQWFECPCHGSKYNRVGEKKAGPAPRGLDRFALDRRRRQHDHRHRRSSRSARRSAPTRPASNRKARFASDQHSSSPALGDGCRVERVVTVRHVLIGLNFVAFVGRSPVSDLGRAVAEARARRDAAREPHAVPPRRGSREPPARARAGLGAALRGGRRGRAAALLAARARPPERSRPTTSTRTRPSAARCLFSNATMPKYDAAVSLQCANCHGPKGEGGPVPFQVNGRAGRLEGAAAQHRCSCASNEDPTVRQPRPAPDLDLQPSPTSSPTAGPGTPMQPWGVDGGGPKNDQSIHDLVAYIASIQLTPERSRRRRRHGGARAAPTHAAGRQREGRMQDTLAADKKTLDRVAAPRRSKALGQARRDRRRAHDGVQRDHQGDHGRPVEGRRPQAGGRVRHVHHRRRDGQGRPGRARLDA